MTLRFLSFNFVLVVATATGVAAQIKKNPAVQQQPKALPQQMPLPSYLKLVTPASEVQKKRLPATTKPVQSRRNFNVGATDVLVNGMDPGSILNYSEVLKTNLSGYRPGDTVPVALSFPVGTSNDPWQYYNMDVKFRAVMPMRQPDGQYFYDLTAPMASNATWSLRYRPTSQFSMLTTFQFTAAGENTCFLSGTQGDLLSLVGRTGQLPAVAMRRPSEPIKTRWHLYQHRCPNFWLRIYNAQYKVFLGRTIVGNRIALVAVSAADAMAGRLPANVSIHWDLRLQGSIKGYVGSVADYIPDRDGDGFRDAYCGGDDCDDSDPGRYPGNTEWCDPNGKDEDCNDATFGPKDADGDGYTDAFCNGNDCDDNNPAIIPGAMIYISETQVEVCGRGIYSVEDGMRAVRQPNGTAIVVPR